MVTRVSNACQELLVVEVERVDLSEEKGEYRDDVIILGDKLLSVGGKPIRGLRGELDPIQDDSVDHSCVVANVDHLIGLKWVVRPSKRTWGRQLR